MAFSKELKKYDIKFTIRETGDYSVFVATRIKDKEKVFIKMPLTEDGKQMILREYHNQKLFVDLAEKRDCGFQFLPITKEDNLIIFPDVSNKVQWLGEPRSKNNRNPEIEAVDNYLDNFMKLQNVMRELNFEDLPRPLQKDWQKRKDDIQINFQNNSKYLLEKDLATESLISKSGEFFDEYGDRWAFQHHDILPWHIGRKNDGSFLLIDSGWAGWSLKYYDFAYFALQVIGYADCPEDSNKLIARARQEYESDPDFESIFKAALSYRAIKLAKELDEQGERSSKRVIEFLSDYLDQK